MKMRTTKKFFAFTIMMTNRGDVYPNPISSSTTISFSLLQSEKAAVVIFDLNGRLIKTFVDAQMSAGVHQIIWSAANENQSTVANGMYYLKLNAGNYSETKST